MGSITIPGGGGTATRTYVVQVSGPYSLKYTDTVAISLFTLPANSFLLNIFYRGITTFNDSGTDTADVGVVSDPDKFANNRVLPSAGTIWLTSNRFGSIIDDEVVIASYEGQNGDATQGEVYLYFEYVTLS